MKPCVKCKAELPDTAGHCVYCGTRQGAQGGPDKSTMMGHPGMLGEMLGKSGSAKSKPFEGKLTPTALSLKPEERAALQKDAKQGAAAQAQNPYGAPQAQNPYGAPQAQNPYGAPQAQNPYGAPQAQNPYGAPQAQNPYGAPQAQNPYGAPQAQNPYGAPQAQNPYGAPPAQNPYGAPQAQNPYGAPQAQNPYGAPQAQNPYGAPQAQQAPYGTPQGSSPYGARPENNPYGTPPVEQKPFGAGPGQNHGPNHGPNPGQNHGPNPGQNPYGGDPQRQASPFGGVNLGIQNAQFGAQAHLPSYPRPGDESYREALTEQVMPLRAPGFDGQLGAWDEALTTQLLVFGVLLIACFVAPWSVSDNKTSFAWSVFSIEGVPFTRLLVPILLPLTGVVAVLMGAIRISPSARALTAAAIGLSPMVVQVASTKPFHWQLPVGVVASLLLISGLIIRSRHTRHALGRILATLGLLALLAIYLVPDPEDMPVMSLLDAVADLPGKGKVLPIIGLPLTGLIAGLLPLFLSVLALLVWLPGPGRAGTQLLAWVHIFWGLVAAVAALAIAGDVVAALKANLSGAVYLPLAGVAWLTLASFGVAGVVANQIES